MNWENFTPLQPADFLAYENFKESLSILKPKDRRKSLKLLVEAETF
jgi:hypothetical protein